MYNWQEEVINKLAAMDKNKMNIIVAGRNVGKSYMAQMWNQMEQVKPPHEILTKAMVDGTMWYTVSCRKDVSMWVRENGLENVDWDEHIDSNWMLHRNIFDVPEGFYMMIKLRWGV